MVCCDDSGADHAADAGIVQALRRQETVRYSIERVRGSCGDASTIALRAHPDHWTPGEGQVEIAADEVARHADPRTLAERWHVVEFEPHRLGADHARLEALLVSAGAPLSGPDPGHSHHTA
jgi:hypothetical protein